MTSKKIEKESGNDENKIEFIRQNWKDTAAQDRIEAMLKKARDLEAISLQYDVVWPKARKNPPFLLPKDEENASIINEVLIKSMETQASTCTGIPQSLVFQGCFLIHGFLHRYFKHIPGIFYATILKIDLSA